MGTTAGDLLSRDVVLSWLSQAEIPFDVAVAETFGQGLDWRIADPEAYSHLVFVCGPFGNGPPLSELLERFSESRLIGLNLSLLAPLEEWDPFEVLFERDSSRCARPDLSLLAQPVLGNVAGLILVHSQKEYGDRGCHAAADAALIKVLEEKQILSIPIDTCLEDNLGRLKYPAQIEALLTRMDFVATTRLHGLVLALKNGVPALAVDPIRGGAKISYQANILAWPAVIGVDDISESRLADLCEYCLTAEAHVKARECAVRAVQILAPLHGEFISAFNAKLF